MRKKLFLIIFAILINLLSFEMDISAQISAIDKNLASEYFSEADELCRRDSGKLWGISLCAPLLFVDRQTRNVVANQIDQEGILKRDGNVFTGQLPSKINIANTALEWSGVKWTMVIFPLPDDKIRRAALLAHEMWHRIQNDINFPDSGAANNHLDSREGRFWLQLEWRALGKALTKRGKERQQAIVDAIVFRTYRQMIFPNAATQEQEMEMHEGLAEYTGVKLSGSPNINQYVVNINLKEASKKETFVRSFAYASVPAYGILLDETKLNWRQNLKKADDLAILLQNKLSIKLPANIKKAAELRAKNYDGNNLQHFENERANQHQKLLSEYRSKLIDGAVLSLPIVKMNMQMNPGNLVPLEPVGTVYPDIRIVDDWGILTAVKGALIKSDFSKIYVSAPINSGGSPIQGDGWTLELNSGWTLSKGERNGDYIVKKTEQ